LVQFATTGGIKDWTRYQPEEDLKVNAIEGKEVKVRKLSQKISACAWWKEKKFDRFAKLN
jgi:hypothetical protein